MKDYIRSLIEKHRPMLNGPTITPIEPDRTALLVTYPQALPAQVVMPLETVESWISILGTMRAGMNPSVPEKSDGGIGLGVMHPSFEVRVDQLSGDVQLYLRDPRYGWLRFAFEKNAARDLACRLQTGADTKATMAGRA